MWVQKNKEATKVDYFKRYIKVVHVDSASLQMSQSFLRVILWTSRHSRSIFKCLETHRMNMRCFKNVFKAVNTCVLKTWGNNDFMLAYRRDKQRLDFSVIPLCSTAGRSSSMWPLFKLSQSWLWKHAGRRPGRRLCSSGRFHWERHLFTQLSHSFSFDLVTLRWTESTFWRFLTWMSEQHQDT